jgi:hypothetical protein
MNLQKIDAIINSLTNQLTTLQVINTTEYISIEETQNFKRQTQERLTDTIRSLSEIINALENVRERAISPETEKDILFREYY